MNVEKRVLTCRLIEQMEENRSYTKKLGLVNCSTYHGKPIEEYPENMIHPADVSNKADSHKPDMMLK